MTRDEYTALPASVALGFIWDNGLGARLADVPAPKPPLPPKYDARVYRKGGHQWASETDLESLLYWHGKYTDNAANGGQYADKDAKRARALDYWISWRKAFPAAAWSGERDNVQVVAAPPSRTPRLHERDNERRAETATKPSFDEEGGTDDIPF